MSPRGAEEAVHYVVSAGGVLERSRVPVPRIGRDVLEVATRRRGTPESAILVDPQGGLRRAVATVPEAPCRAHARHTAARPPGPSSSRLRSVR